MAHPRSPLETAFSSTRSRSRLLALLGVPLVACGTPAGDAPVAGDRGSVGSPTTADAGWTAQVQGAIAADGLGDGVDAGEPGRASPHGRPAAAGPDAGVPLGIDVPPAASPSDDWQAIVMDRIAAEGRAIRATDDGFAADLPSLGLSALFTDSVTVADADGQTALTLGAVSWGRGDALVPIDTSEQALGDCTDDTDASGNCIARLEASDIGVTAWWVGRGDGFEQGWTVDAAPDGAGLLAFEVPIDGATAALETPGGAEIDDTNGRAWTVGSVVAWDAAGRALPARLSIDGGALRLEVDDTGAAYPVTVDPVYTTASWTADGASACYLGRSVASAGDVNHDGYDDVVIGAMGYGANTGRAYVYLGGASGLSSTAAATLTGESSGSYFSYSVASAGDVNNDGYDDVVVGAYGYSSTTGRAYVYLGNASGLSSTAATTLTGSSASAFGLSVAGAGDVNNDGYAERLLQVR